MTTFSLHNGPCICKVFRNFLIQLSCLLKKKTATKNKNLRMSFVVSILPNKRYFIDIHYVHYVLVKVFLCTYVFLKLILERDNTT